MVKKWLLTEPGDASHLLQDGSATNHGVGDTLQLRWLGDVSAVAIT